ncbi:iron chaperone [Sinomicrobium weinanense]|uniref:DUF1801 domain-containing protein n=1 Tax=Sinomicrobium weinanense TaxID=2842200 RepID=A0A926JU21_9FLAO|nr:DUF1801 domain-containing protein [Sinomicrobium weinanense]MBC9797374.1 DUF1801 domain-containing protein [Sinomicrobium weinanense]MBU3123395.1 DUF1801 domain-containing protein [Sinomicrobium weinanense]
MPGTNFKTVDEYLDTFPQRTRKILEKVREAIRETAPEAEEVISYQMPTYKLGKNLVHFAGYANHIGFYPTPSAITAFADELKGYKTSKGAVQFPLDHPLPLELITRIVQFRIKENAKKQS